ncbi:MULTISPECIES: host specificity factor TipJ family phage tail protein [unclassified Pseudoalteromonas]|uniref:host specificity factor TipJ family phage tail protein n=1 Tax=unclassified Pseudoalteromonas TaxID=194690 RepID=UPI000403A9A4|nr:MULTISPECIES: host specificity factor TipJ family phage tail protein [unclassified Pseudoalteromonas]
MSTQVEIKVYPNKLDKKLFESCIGVVGQTLDIWLKESVPAYDDREQPLFSAAVNSKYLPPSDWPTYIFKQGDNISLTVEAKDPATIAYAIIAIVAVGVAIYTANQIPDNYNSTTPDGSSIYDVNTQGNKPRLMGIIPEGAGRHLIYPDYLTMPRREYINNEQWLYLMLSVGSGEYEILPEEVFIANTPVKSYTGDVFYEIFGPGEDVSGHEGHRNVYTSSEVGSTSGSTGIELKGRVTSAGGSESSKYSYSFSAKEVVVHFEEYEPEVGKWKHKSHLPFTLGEIIKVEGASNVENDGYYEIITKDIDGSELKKLDGQYQEDTTWTGFTPEANTYAKVYTEDGGGDGEFNGPFFAVPEGEVTDQLWLDFSLPQGLGELDDQGNFLTRSVNLVVEYRAEGALEWIQAPVISFSGKTNDQLGKTIPISLSEKIRPEVRVKRSTAANDDTRIYDDVYWTALKAELESATTYQGMTTLAVRIRGTNNLAGSAENKFNLIATRVLPVFENGAWSAPRPTTDIAPFFAHVIKSAGHGDSKIGLDALEALHPIWQARGDEFNAVFDSESTMFEVIKRVLAVGFAEPTIDYGQITPVRDQKRTIYKHMYQPDNYIGMLKRSIKLIDDDEPDGIEVEYFSPITWKSETILCLLPGDLGINPEKIRAFGITSRDKAYQFGMRKRRTRRYRRTRFDFKTEMDALNSRYLDYCALADDIPGFEQTGRVLLVNGRSILVDNDNLNWQTEESHILALRKPDGTLSGPYSATPGTIPNEVIINADLDFTPVFDGSIEPPLYMFGINERWCNGVLIRDIKPSSTDKVSVTAELDDARVYLDDDSLAM